MINYYLTETVTLRKLAAPQSNCWVSMVAPTEQELETVSDHYCLEIDVLRAALDSDETSRIDAGENYSMVLVNIPAIDEKVKLNSIARFLCPFLLCGMLSSRFAVMNPQWWMPLRMGR